MPSASEKGFAPPFQSLRLWGDKNRFRSAYSGLFRQGIDSATAAFMRENPQAAFSMDANVQGAFPADFYIKRHKRVIHPKANRGTVQFKMKHDVRVF